MPQFASEHFGKNRVNRTIVHGPHSSWSESECGSCSVFDGFTRFILDGFGASPARRRGEAEIARRPQRTITFDRFCVIFGVITS